MKVLVTGAQGLIGRTVVASLAGAHDVWATSRTPELPAPGVNSVTIDLAAPTFLAALPNGIDTIVHLAQSPHYAAFPDRALDVFQVNVQSTALLLDWGRRHGLRRFILASAGGVETPSPSGGHLSYYLGSKRSAELLAAAYRDQFAVVTLRFHFVYGRGQRPTMLVPRLVAAVRARQPIQLAGPDGIHVSPTHVDDAAAAVVAAAALEESVTIEVAGPESLSLRQIGECIGRRLMQTPAFEVQPRGHARDLVPDTSVMRSLLGAPTRRFAEGIGDLL
jgi:UDP-glucose 4-epimerase